MTAPAIPLPPSAPNPLHARRCVRHPAREAAARCPGCGEFFCRECVVEHAGRLLCAACLQRIARRDVSRRERFAALLHAATTLAAAVMLGSFFYWLGAILVKIPPEFHDGTVWKKAVERVNG